MQMTKIANSGPNAARTLIVIPVFNEFKYVDELLRAVQRYSQNILVVDDGSTDGTSDALHKHTYLHIISHKPNKGYGQSLIEAFSFAHSHNFNWLITIDCDHQHEPSHIPRFYTEIEKGDADIISGSRYMSGEKSGADAPPADRAAINRKITNIFNRALGLRLTDSFCGFKAYKTSAIFKLRLTEEGYGFPLQLWVRAARAGLKIREISVPLIYHDPKRNFSGALEDPHIRFDYYIRIIEKELGFNVSKNLAKSFNS